MRKRSIEETLEQINLFYQTNYSKSTCSVIVRISKKFLEYLTTNKFEYSENIAQDWLTLQMKKFNGNYSMTMKYYHTINLIIDYYNTGNITYQQRYFLTQIKKEPCTHVWKHQLDLFVEELELEKMAESTISFTHRACTKFIQYLEEKGCLIPEDLTNELCKSFSKEEHLLLLNSKRAYLHKIKQFIRFLERADIVSNTLEYAINTNFRIPKPTISILSNEQQLEVIGNKKTKNALLNRSYAMGTLALYLALRSIDIINLKKCNVSWTDKTISITQMKTKTLLLLPLPAIVGNALADYLLNYRPQSDSPYIFISHLKPYEKLVNKASCYESSIKLIKHWDINQKKGLHSFRKTCASRLVNSGEKLSIASAFIGHINTESIKPYLSLNEERMKDCALTLDIIGIPEAFKC
jgi:site-specific recombinase XerD